MIINKKMLLGLGIMPISILPILALVSCSPNTATIDLGISKELKKYYGDKLAQLPQEKKLSVRLITACGRVTDKSFNESTNGALNLYADQTNQHNHNISYIETKNIEDLGPAYDQSLNEKVNVWVLTGFQQQDEFSEWLSKGDNRTKFITLKAIVIGVDWDGSNFVPKGQFFGLGFSTEESSWIIAQAASEYLVNKGLPTQPFFLCGRSSFWSNRL